MDWFRLYAEFATDPKVQSMSESMQRRLIMLMCLRCSNGLVTLHDDEIAFALRVSEEDLAQTKLLFIKKGFISEDWEFVNWDKRQYVSDSSAARVAKHRSKKKAASAIGEDGKNGVENTDAKSDVTGGNVTVTPPDTDTDTDTDTETTHHTTSGVEKNDAQSPVLASGAVGLSVQFRKNGVRTNPGNPVLMELAGQGVTPELVQSACDEAKSSKKGAPFSLGYVVAILNRWAVERSGIRVEGAAAPVRQPVGKFNPTLYVNQGRVAS